LKVTSLHEPALRSLAERYRHQDPGVVSLFGAHPSRAEDWRDRAAWLHESATRRADKAKVAGVLRQYHAGLPAHPAVQHSLERLGQANSLVVVGGQQAGLFGGALMIFHKARSVIQAARFAEQLLGCPVVPVFWIAGEDHDFDEANHVHVQRADGAVKRIRIERPEGPRLAVSRTPISRDSWEAALAGLAAELPDTAYKADLLAKLGSHLTDSPTLSLAFARLLAEWFGPEGLVLMDADDPALRALEGPMFRQLIENNERLESALDEGQSAVTALGLPLQAESVPGGANLFLHHETGRLLLARDNGSYVNRKSAVSMEREELLALADRMPEKLSTNALSRPLMQDYVLPVLAAVLGPSELAYWGVLGPAFEAFGLRMPVMVPRQSYTYLDPQTLKLLDRFSLTPELAMRQWEEMKEAWLSAQIPWDMEGAFRSAKEQFLAMYSPLIEKVSAMQPGLASLTESNRGKMLAQIDYLATRTRDAMVKQHEDELRQWEWIRSSLAPGGKPQERVYGTIQYWNLYGPDWLQGWRDVPFEPTGSHRLVEDVGCMCGTK